MKITGMSSNGRGQLNGLCPGAGDAGHPVADVGHDCGDVHCDDRFIFDHQNAARDRIFHLTPGNINEISGFSGFNRHDGSDFSRGEAFDSMQQQSLARVGGQAFHMGLGAGGQSGVRLSHRSTGAGPDHVKGAEQRDLHVGHIHSFVAVGQNRFQRGGSVSVAGQLAARQRAGVTAQVGQVCANGRRKVRRVLRLH
jgi:hypothetical protein